MVVLGPVPDEEVDLLVRTQPGRQACANIKDSREQALKELRDGFYDCEAGRSKSKRLHRLGYGWMVPGVDYFVYSFKGPLVPQEHQALQRCLVHTKATRQWIRHGRRLISLCFSRWLSVTAVSWDRAALLTDHFFELGGLCWWWSHIVASSLRSQ